MDTEQKIDTKIYDIAIVGLGTSGSLLLRRLAQFMDPSKIIALEQENAIGGRLKSGTYHSELRGKGLFWLTSQLDDVIQNCLKLNPESPQDDTPLLMGDNAFLSGGKFSTVEHTKRFTETGARALGGLAAKRAWPAFEKAREAIESGKRKNQVFQSVWSETRKSPAAMVLEQYFALEGIADIWSTRSDLLFELASDSSEKICRDWELQLESLLEDIPSSQILRNDSALEANQLEDGTWMIQTSLSKTIQAKQVVVAHPPWQALDWLPKQYWNKHLLQFAVKSKPTSSVCLSIKATSETCQALIEQFSTATIVSENTVITPHPSGEIVFRIAIDYEISLQAPEVVKAIKALKRARKKFFKTVDLEDTFDEHYSLVPIAWCHSTDLQDFGTISKFCAKRSEKDSLHFVGDAYGTSSEPDNNLIESVDFVFGLLNNSESVSSSKTDEPKPEASETLQPEDIDTQTTQENVSEESELNQTPPQAENALEETSL